MSKRVLSGIKPTGQVQLGNYLGAMRRWVDDQTDQQNFYFIPNLHALTIRPNPKELANQTRSTIAWLLAMGIDTKKYDSTIFLQSHVPAHSELAWVLNNFVTMGELSRMTQFKDKSQKNGSDGQVVGIFDYPVLMAADILLYDADEVPVGDDQKQHVELTRDIATRFNNLYGQTFKIPSPTLPKIGARIMDLQDPTKKMSKSDIDSSGCIFLDDSAETIRSKFQKAVTDSGKVIEATDDKPALSNMLQIYSLMANRSVIDIEEEYVGRGYADFKNDLAELVISILIPLQNSYSVIIEDHNQIDSVLKEGSEKANEIANSKIKQVYSKLGL
ncbi:MAG: tryptophan--tRNA ligase [Candidatus Saccharimonadia bacterium]